jgi:type IV pilus assembly protein PilC
MKMPYFSWEGVDVYGTVHTGKTFARSTQELDERLFARKIALLHAGQARSSFFRLSHVGSGIKKDFFQQVAQLLQAGILLPEALLLVSDQQNHGTFQETLYAITQSVCEGKPLHQALEQHPRFFEPLMIEIARVGQESGNLALALQALAEYLHEQESFYKRLRAALVLPLITFGFFIVVLGIILFGIIPQFAIIFASLGKETPAATQVLLSLNTWFSGWRLSVFVSVLFLIFFAMYRFYKTGLGRSYADAFFLKIPFVGRMIRQRASAHFLHALSLLLDGGMPLVPALNIAKKVVSNQILRAQLEQVVAEVGAGVLLSDALVMIQDPLVGPDSISLIVVGQESGRLSFFLARSAYLLQERVQHSVSFVATIIQPLLVIILGLLITLLIIAVYMPVLNLAALI